MSSAVSQAPDWPRAIPPEAGIGLRCRHLPDFMDGQPPPIAWFEVHNVDIMQTVLGRRVLLENPAS